jgi:hypothetical protein
MQEHLYTLIRLLRDSITGENATVESIGERCYTDMAATLTWVMEILRCISFYYHFTAVHSPAPSTQVEESPVAGIK